MRQGKIKDIQILYRDSIMELSAALCHSADVTYDRLH